MKNKIENFWEEIAQNFEWNQKWDSVLEGDFHDLNIKWFNGAKLNITSNCLDRHLDKIGDKTALIWEPNDPKDQSRSYTYKELHNEVCRVSNMLKKSGITKGDIVCLYMPMIPEFFISVLACARLGAPHSVVFGGFSDISLAGRINDCQAKILITADGGYRGSKLIKLKETVDLALENCPSVEKCLVYKHVGNTINTQPRDIFWDEEISGMSDSCTAEIVDSEHPLFILYTSGSTGKPKGVVHTTGGYMVGAGYTLNEVFQVDNESIYWCTADIGWITGHTYLTYGPLLNGLTTVMFEGTPTYPDAGRFWDIIEKNQVTHFYTAPTAIRALQACDQSFTKRNSLSSLKVLGSVGEPINEEAWHWYYSEIGKNRCPIVDTWWQTETGSIMISPIAGKTKLKPGYATEPLKGIYPVLMNSDGQEIEEEEAQGNLCLKYPWPSMARTIYGDHDRYRSAYFSAYPGYYFTGDGAKRENGSFYRITGRVDDVINISGHRIGTAEVEDALDLHHDVVEAAVVGYAHEIKGQAICAFVIGSKNLSCEELTELVIKNIGAIARPDKIIIVNDLPKTRSGKIMRRILRKIADGEKSDFGDISTLLNPEVVADILKGLD